MNEQTTKEAQETRKPRNAGRIRRALEEYNRRYPALTDGNFTLSDYHEIKTLALEDYPAFDPPRMVLFALEAGFIRGYKRAQRDARKKRAPDPIGRAAQLAAQITRQLPAADEAALDFIAAFLGASK